jgi:hypothetical protein
MCRSEGPCLSLWRVTCMGMEGFRYFILGSMFFQNFLHGGFIISFARRYSISPRSWVLDSVVPGSAMPSLNPRIKLHADLRDLLRQYESAWARSYP